jgi:hypothetical protein
MKSSCLLGKFIVILSMSVVGLLSMSCSKDDDVVAADSALSINLSEDEIMLEVGKSERLIAGFEPSDAPNQAHKWTAEDPQIATVDETGLVTGVSTGTTVITVTALANNATASCVVNVMDKIIPVSSISLSSTKETLVVGSALQLTAVISPYTATDRRLRWSSNNPSVASVNDEGLVVAITPGEANITVSAGGKSTVCAITVVDKSVDFSDIRYSVIEGGLVRIYGTINPQGMELSEIGVCFSTSTTPTVNSEKCVLPLSLNIDGQLKGLKPDTEYYIRAYALADNEVYYGKTEIIKTSASIATDFKLSKLYIDRYNDGKTCEMTLLTPVISGQNSLKICYGVAPHPEITDNITTSSANSTGEGFYSTDFKNLKEATTYYFRAYELINNKPVYYDTEGVFSTIGKDVKIDATTNSSTAESEWIYNINYTLPSGTYKVTQSSGSLSKTNADWSNMVYVSGGKGSVNLKLKPRHYYEKYNGAASIFFENIETGVSYQIRIGRSN